MKGELPESNYMTLPKYKKSVSAINTSTSKKHEIRKKILELRNNVPASYRTKTDREIILALSELPEYKTADIIFCFVGVGNEIDTMPFINMAIQSGKRVCTPRCIDDVTMGAYEVTGLDDLDYGMYGFLEPGSHCKLINPADISLAVIPCLACDTAGHRIGYGGGYYDKYLADKAFCKAVLCREQAIIDKVPAESYDVTADIVITEKHVYRTGMGL